MQFLAGFCLVFGLASSLGAQATAQAKGTKKQRAAESRALFATTEPLPFTLIADFGTLAKDRDTLSTKKFSGVLVVADSAGSERRIPVQLRTRGHFRLMMRNCRFVPLRVEFPDSGRKGTPFANQRSLKLGSHCQNGDKRYDEYTRREYLAYKLFNEITERSFRARLAVGTYVDSTNGKVVDRDRAALFIESEEDLSSRLGGKIRELRNALFDDLDGDQLLAVSLFEYAIGNTDWSIAALHNVRLAMMPNGVVHPLIYDFDFSGFVGAHYATPDPRMGIRNVKERKFRGPCRPEAAYRVAAKRFADRKEAIYEAIRSVPGMPEREQNAVREYLREFFEIVESPGRLKREVVDQCETRAGM